MNAPTVATLTQPEWQKPETKEAKLQRWLAAKDLLDKAKDAEMEARKAVVAAYPFDAGKKEGTQRLDLANGWQLKVVLKQNYKLDKDATDAALDKIEASGPEGKFIGERLVKWSPDLSLSEYRVLPPALKTIIDGVLTITDGSPTLELVEPKVKK